MATGSNPNPANGLTNRMDGYTLLDLISARERTNDIVLAWKTAGPRTNVVQFTSDLRSNFTDIGAPVIIGVSGDAVTNCVLPGEVINPTRFYRVRLGP